MADSAVPEGRLTDLEAITLAWIHKSGSATPYAVRVHFEQSPSARFSGSAGAIYPLMRRLEKRGLLESEPVSKGQRKGRVYRLTTAGRRAVKGWLKGPWDAASLFTFDPLRTRMIYLGSLTPRERARWLDDAEAALQAQDEIIKTFADTMTDDPFLVLANDNALRETKARLAWIRKARDMLA